MKGKVIKIDKNNPEMIVVRAENDRIVFIELLGHEVEIGDIISGELENLGGETLYNHTQSEELDAFIQDLN